MKVTIANDDGVVFEQLRIKTDSHHDMVYVANRLRGGIHDEFGECDCRGLYRPWREMVPRDAHDELGQYVCPEHLTAA